MTDEQPSPTTRIPTPDAAAGETSTWSTDRPPAPGSTLPTAPATPPAPPAPSPATEPAVPPASTGTADEPVRKPPARDRGRMATVLLGVVVLAIGLWFFAEQTLGIDLPAIRWSQLWPLILIVIGGWILLVTLRRGSR